MTADGSPTRFSARSIFNASALVFAASMILSLGGFGFHAIASRHLGVDHYGMLYALISLYSLAVIPVTLFTPVVAKVAAEFGALHDDAHVRGLIQLLVRWFGTFALIYVVVGFVLERPLGLYLHVPAWQVPLAGCMAAIGIVSGTFRAIGQGVHDYVGYGLSMAAEGIAKVVILAAFAAAGLTLFLGGLAFALGMLAGAIIIVITLAARYGRVSSVSVILDWKRILTTTAAAASLTLTMTLVGFADVLIVKHYFPGNEAGLYAAVSLCAKMLLYFVGFVPAILIPQAAHRHTRGERTRGALWVAIIFVALASLIGVLVYRFFGYIVLHALVGHAFDSALPILPTYAGAMAFLAMTSTLGAYALATHRLAFVVPLVCATLGTLAWISVLHPSLAVVADELLLGTLAMLIALAVPLAIQGRKALHR